MKVDHLLSPKHEAQKSGHKIERLQNIIIIKKIVPIFTDIAV